MRERERERLECERPHFLARSAGDPTTNQSSARIGHLAIAPGFRFKFNGQTACDLAGLAAARSLACQLSSSVAKSRNPSNSLERLLFVGHQRASIESLASILVVSGRNNLHLATICWCIVFGQLVWLALGEQQQKKRTNQQVVVLVLHFGRHAIQAGVVCLERRVSKVDR